MKRKQLTYLILLAASLLAPYAAKAEQTHEAKAEQPVPVMTLRDCLLYARQHAHRVRAARLAADEASADVGLTAAAMMPRLDLYGNGNISFGRNIDPATNTYDNKQTLSTGFGLQASVPLFDGLVNFNNLRSARVARQRAQVRLPLEEDEALTEVIKQFYQAIYCKAMVEAAEQQLRRDSTDLAATQRGEQLGSKSGADVAEIEALVAADRYQLLNQRNLLEKARLDLRAAMGMPLDLPLPTLQDAADDSEQTQKASEHPKLKDARLAVEGSRFDLLVAKGAFFPSISLSGGISTSYYKMLNTEAAYPGFGRQARDNMGEYIGLSIGLPLFDGLYNAKRLKKARIRLKENELQLEERSYQLEKETAQAAMDYQGASEELEAARQRVAAEELAFRATRRKYELGDASALDLYTASEKLASARALQEGKRIQKIINLITWRYCQGIPLLSN